MSKYKNRQGFWRFGVLLAVLLFCSMLWAVLLGTLRLSGRVDAEGLAATRSAIERASVLCYATEGFYPPGIQYLERNYGIQIDHGRYSVRYEVFSPAVTPTIIVVPKG